MSVEIMPFKKLGFLPVHLACYPLRRAMLELELGESKPDPSQLVRTVHDGDEKSSFLIVGNTEIKSRNS